MHTDFRIDLRYDSVIIDTPGDLCAQFVPSSHLFSFPVQPDSSSQPYLSKSYYSLTARPLSIRTSFTYVLQAILDGEYVTSLPILEMPPCYSVFSASIYSK